MGPVGWETCPVETAKRGRTVAKPRAARAVEAARSVNPTVLLVVQFGALAGAARWGLARDVPAPLAVLLAVAAPALLTGLWALCAARRAPYRARGGVRAGFEVLWFGAGVAALTAVGDTGGAVALAVLAAASRSLAVFWDQLP